MPAGNGRRRAHELHHLAGRVWLWPHDPDPGVVQGCVAVIVDDSGSLLVDAGNGPTAARAIRKAIQEAGLPAPVRLVYTHHHWDHVWGACAWPEVEVVGHVDTARLLEREARRPWSTQYLQEQMEHDARLVPSFSARARAMPSWEGFQIVLPHTEFTESLRLADGVEVHHVGGLHAEDSSVVAVPDSRVVLLGDCFYPPPWHLRGPDDGLDADQLRALSNVYANYDWFVDSHGAPAARSEFLESLSPPG